MFRKLLAIPLIVILVLGMMVPTSFAEQKGFTDVAEDDWYYSAVTQLSELGIIAGYSDGSFKPQESVQRDAFATMMVKALNLKLEKPEAAWFKDVDKSNWAYKYVETAKYYMTGYKSGDTNYFKPSENAVREDMAVALVKALKYDIKGNTTYLNAFSDADDISENLKDYVATAVKHGLMSGSSSGSQLLFNPQSDLSRAETAALLMNLIESSAGASDAEKVTFDDMTAPDSHQENSDVHESDDKDSKSDSADESTHTTTRTAQIEVTQKDDKLLLEWNKVNESGFKGYKVVASKSDTSPTYPENGYFKYITDVNSNRVEIKPYNGYNGGDVGKFEPGVKYHFSITALYEDGSYYGRNESAVMPGEVQESKEYVTPKVEVEIEDGYLKIEWDKIEHPHFEGYKVVASKSDESPAYPENGYYKWITDKNVTSTEIWSGASYNNGDVGQFKSGETYYFSVTAVYSDKKIAGNVIRKTLP